MKRIFPGICVVAFNLGFALSGAAQSSRDYAVEPSIGSAALSPDGQILALGVAQADSQQIKLITLDGISAVSSESVDIEYPRNAREEIHWLGWAGDERLLSYVSFIDSGHKNKVIGTARLASMDRAGKDFKDLGVLGGLSLRGTGDRFNGGGIISLLPKDPDHVLVGLGEYGATRLNISTGNAELLRRGNKTTQSWTPDLRGEVRVGQGVERAKDKYHLIIRDSNSASWRKYSEYKGLNADERVVGFTSNPDELIIARYGTHDTLEFQIYDLRTRSITKTLFSDPQYDAQSLIYNSAYDEVIGVQYISNAPRIRYLDNELTASIDIVTRRFPNMNVTLLSEDRQGEKSVFQVSSGSKPGVVVLFDKSTGEHKVISADYPALADIRHGEVRPVSYSATDGTSIPGYLTLPAKSAGRPEARNLPFVVLPHGGPYSREYADFDWLEQFLVSRGYGVLKMNFRGSTGYGESFQKQGRDDWGLMLSDVDDGAKWLISQGLADPERVCIVGWSFGGYLAQTAASDSADLYQCAASINGVSNWVNMPSFDDVEFWGQLNDSETKKYKASPQSKVENVSVPVYLAHAELDTVVPYSQFKKYKSGLKKKKKDFDAHSFENADHDIADVENRTKLLDSLEVFLTKHLGESDWAN